MKFLGVSRGLKGPFMLLSTDEMLFPQYDRHRDARQFLESDSVRKFLRDAAIEHLVTDDRKYVSPEVLAHWQKLANSPTEGI